MGCQEGRDLNIWRAGVLSVGMAFLGIATATAAQEDANLSELEWFANVPIISSATRQSQKLTDAPSSTTVITREMIAALGTWNLAEIMSLVPGFQVFYSNGSTFGVTPHGLSDRDPRRMEVRVNGRSVYLPQLSSVSWESLGILPDDVDHIEVVRGSNVPAYGSNAILGAINIITKNPVEEVGGALSTSIGSADTRILSGRQQFSTASTDILVRAAYKENSGFDGVDDDGDVRHLVIHGVHAADLHQSIELELGFSDGTFGVGDGDHLDEFSDDKRKAAWLGINWSHTSEKQIWKAHLSYSDYDYEQHRYSLLSTEGGVPPEWIPLLFPGHVDELIEMEVGQRDFSVLSAELEHHVKVDKDLRLLWGLGYKEDRISSKQFFDTNDYLRAETYYLFFNTEWRPMEPWVINAGFMYEKRTGADNDFSPRIAANYHFNSNHHLRASASRTYRQPAMTENNRLWVLRFANGDMIDAQQRSHPGIDSETGTSYELGYMGYWHDGDLGLDVKLFREEIEAGIDGVDTTVDACENPMAGREALAAEFCASFYVGDEYGAPVNESLRVLSNASNWETEGVEVQLTYRPSVNTLFYAQYAYLYVDGKRLRNIATSEPSPYSTFNKFLPVNSGGILVSQRLDQWLGSEGWTLSSYLSYRDFVSWRSGAPVDSYWRLDLKLAKNWRWATGEFELAARLENALNDKYLEFQANNEFQRRSFVSLRYSWR